MYLLSVDPSINNLGWAIFNLESGKLEGSGVVHNIVSVDQKLEKRIRGIICALTNAVWKWLKRIQVTVIEKPHMWGAYKSVASAHSGSLLSLHILVGALFWYMSEHECFLIRVSEYKGQLPKEVCAKKMRLKYGIEKFKSNDESDAIYLGDWFLTKRMEKCASNMMRV